MTPKPDHGPNAGSRRFHMLLTAVRVAVTILVHYLP